METTGLPLKSALDARLFSQSFNHWLCLDRSQTRFAQVATAKNKPCVTADEIDISVVSDNSEAQFIHLIPDRSSYDWWQNYFPSLFVPLLVIVGKRCILVPYRRQHVLQYHQWMQDPEMLQSTGSEPLSLESEYEMQAIWRDDDQKCTFIVLDREKVHASWIDDVKTRADSGGVIPSNFITDSLSAMVGDVNLFFSEFEESDDETDQVVSTSPAPHDDETTSGSPLQAEVDIMIAESSSRGKGIGLEAVLLMMGYAQKHLPVVRFFCKINADNGASRKLFGTKLSFRVCDYAECFHQYEYEMKQGSECWDALQTLHKHHDLSEQETCAKFFRCPVSSVSPSIS